MALIKVSTNYNIDLEFEIPEFHRRLFAWAIDLFIQAIYLILAFKIYSLVRSNSYDEDSMHDFYGIILMIFLPFFLYHLLSEITLNGQSVGKKLMRIRVINENGGKASNGQLIIRSLDYTFILLTLLLTGGEDFGQFKIGALALVILLSLAEIIVVVTSQKSQRFGDMLAHTILINTKTRGDIGDTVFLEVANSYVPSFPQIMQLSDKDINAIKNILDTARKKGDFQLAEMAAGKIKNHLKIETTMPSFDFLDTLLKDYNYLSVK